MGNSQPQKSGQASHKLPCSASLPFHYITICENDNTGSNYFSLKQLCIFRITGKINLSLTKIKF